MGEKIYEVMGDLNYVVQEEQLGTGHAVNQARDVLGGECRDVLVLCGDTPLIRGDTLKALLGQHREREAAATILTAEIADPRGYGRIIRNESGSVTEIVEDADASPRELEIKEVNSGTYIFNRTELFLALENIKPDNVQGEYYSLMSSKTLTEGKGWRLLDWRIVRKFWVSMTVFNWPMQRGF